MSLKLIREAQLRSTLKTEELELLEAAKVALGKSSLVELMEAFAPSPDDYATWLDVIIGYAQDEGLDIKRRADFNEVAHAVLENDPMNPPANMRTHIVNRLWTEMKAKSHQTKIDGIVQAQEEEEQLDRAARAMAGDIGDDEAQSMTLSDVSRLDDEGGDDDHHDVAHIEDGRCSNCGSEIEDDQGEGDHLCDEPPCDDESAEDSSRVGSVLKLGTMGGTPNNDRGIGLPGEEENEEKAAPTNTSVANMWHAGFLDGYKDRNKRFPTDKQYCDGFKDGGAAREHHATHPEENEEAGPMTAKTGQEVKPKGKSLLHHVITGPKDTISKALKTVETDGESAWKGHQLPSNPHPKQSMAHRAWEKGLKKAMKAHFGLDDKPPVSTSKSRKK